MSGPSNGEKPLRALSVRQPWASALVMGLKPVENRTWCPPASVLTGLEAVAIHASLKPDREAIAAFSRGEYGLSARDYLTSDIPVGCIVGVVAFWDHTHAAPDGFNPWWRGPCAWGVQVFHRLSLPLGCKGRLGLWRVPRLVDEAIRAQVDPADVLRHAAAMRLTGSAPRYHTLAAQR